MSAGLNYAIIFRLIIIIVIHRLIYYDLVSIYLHKIVCFILQMVTVAKWFLACSKDLLRVLEWKHFLLGDWDDYEVAHENTCRRCVLLFSTVFIEKSFW